MNIKITADYTGETGEILVCTHESTGDTMTIMAGALHLQITVKQTKALVEDLNRGIDVIEKYQKLIKNGSTNGG